jgi:hypothetical protein
MINIQEKEKLYFSPLLRNIGIAMIAVGIAAFAYAFITNPQKAWANYLLNNYYFLSLAIGASFFYALQYITQSGWSSGFKRIPEAMFGYIPVAAVFFILLFFGMHTLYEWSHNGAAAHDELIAHKSPYLNVPFFFIRIVVFFAAWILLTRYLRKLSLQEDKIGGLASFQKSEFYSKVFIFILGVTFSLSAIDWIKSIEVHWFSTLFALKNFISAFLHGTAAIVFIALILNYRGYFKFINGSHLHDFNRYMFILSIFYGYFWFSQFMLIWYANIPEETVYYAARWGGSWKAMFFADIIVNWFIPFVILLPPLLSRKKALITFMAGLLLVGFYIDCYMQIMPALFQDNQFGLIEIGSFVGYAGLFILVVSYQLSKAPIIARNHPYLEESLYHHFHQ